MHLAVRLCLRTTMEAPASGADPPTLTSLSLGARPAVNVNLGVMGHVDSGKTALARALSTTVSAGS